jgi:hypothetical protein
MTAICSCAGAACQFGNLRTDKGHESLLADAVSNTLRDRREVRIEIGGHGVLSQVQEFQVGVSARIAQAINVSAWFLGSESSRPDSQARQNICAGPIIWL